LGVGCLIYIGILIITKGFSRKDITLWRDVFTSMIPTTSDIHD
jgi:hypothetical protein